MSKPIISVVLPTYQPEDYISDCLTSLSQQTLAFESFEVIIILNGDENPYFECIRKKIEKLDDAMDVQLFYTETKGVSNARNLGLQLAKGTYIAFLDDDDFLSVNYLEHLFKSIFIQSEEIQESTIACSNFKTFDGKSYGEDYLSKAYKKCTAGKYSLFKYRHFLSGISGKLIPKAIIDEIRFNNELTIGEDSVFLFELSNRINKMILSEEDVYYVRRIRKGSALRTERNFKEKCSIFLKLSVHYSKIYFKSPFKYSFTLYVSRILAGLRTLVQSV